MELQEKDSEQGKIRGLFGEIEELEGTPLQFICTILFCNFITCR
jgi:hypothetical protein